MGTFGDRLRREREQRGISLEDIALSTKIRAGLLQALEEEKFDRLPGGIFNKGFVRAYARHLGLDEAQTVADYLVASGEAPVRKPPEGRADVAEPRIQLVRDEPEPDANSGSPLNLRGILAGLLVLVLVGAVAWIYYHREKQAEALPSSQPAAVASPVQTGAAPPPTSEATPTPAAPVDQAPQKSPAQEAAPSARTNPAASVPANTEPVGTFAVHLKADEDCWVQITSDGKTEEVTLAAGLEKLITARHQVTIRAGSVGALDISFNGKKIPSQGDYGQVKTLVFAPDGLQPPAPKPITAPPTTP